MSRYVGWHADGICGWGGVWWVGVKQSDEKGIFLVSVGPEGRKLRGLDCQKCCIEDAVDTFDNIELT